MKTATALLFATTVLIAAAGQAAAAPMRIVDDRGGRIGSYVDKYQSVRASGERVVIDGMCASACTIVLGAIPRSRICVTPHANLGFHAAYDFDETGRKVTNPEATQLLYSMYPSSVRKWIAARGGLTPRMMFLRGPQLAGMFKPCVTDIREAAASADVPAQDDARDGAKAKLSGRSGYSGSGLGDLFSGLTR